MEENLTLRDIKPLMEIPDYSYYLFLGAVVFVVTMVVLFLYFLGKRWWHSRKVNLKKLYFQKIKTVDWNDPKHAAYTVTKLGRYFIDDKRCKEIYRQLVPMLEAYKYRREIPSVESETLKQYNLLVHVIDESL